MAKQKTFRDFTVRLHQPTFVGQGLDGHLAPEGSVVTIPLQIADQDIQDEDGNVTTRAGEPIYDDNLEILEDVDALEAVPAGAPNGARPTGVPGVYMIPVGDNWQVWMPGDPSTEIARRSPEEFQATNPDAPSIAETLEKQGLDHDKDGKAGGYVTKAQIAAELDDRKVTYDPKAGREELADLLAKDKAKG